VSAHRTPDWMFEYAEGAEARGLEVIIAAAGGAAHLPGMVAAKTVLPVLGVPVPATALQGVDALLSIVQMPEGRARRHARDRQARRGQRGLLAARSSGCAPRAARAAAGVARRAHPRGPGASGGAERNAARCILPGATIGILGGGQLGRMTAMAARAAGLPHRTSLDPDPSLRGALRGGALHHRGLRRRLRRRRPRAPAATWSRWRSRRSPSPASTRARRYAPVRPSSAALSVIQDRGRPEVLAERPGGLPSGPWRRGHQRGSSPQARRVPRGRCFVKACSRRLRRPRPGADHLRPPRGVRVAWASRRSTCVVEQALAIEAELSVLVARSPSGRSRCIPPALNHHVERVLAWSVLPAPVEPGPRSERRGDRPRRRRGARGRGPAGGRAVRRDGGALLVNELAPRPHNSYHARGPGCVTSQFEQACAPCVTCRSGRRRTTRPAAIYNLLGDLAGGRPAAALRAGAGAPWRAAAPVRQARRPAGPEDGPPVGERGHADAGDRSREACEGTADGPLTVSPKARLTGR
jgi:5-(carboxyamino)imidazole ribonucleotide synthase